MASELTERQRAEQLALRALTVAELTRLWPTLDVRRLDETFPGWLAAVARLITTNRRISAVLAARYLRQFRTAAGVGGDAPIVLARPVVPEQLVTAMRVTSLVSIKRGVAAGSSAQVALGNAFVTSSGAATRLVLDGGRDTLRGSLAADPDARGWRRVTSGRACGFCRMLSGRGAVYAARTADFSSHDHCACGVEPVYGGDFRAVRAFTPSQRPSNAADRARVRAYVAAND